jgi:FKBP-type peptidyl-prolyl cis-trans isomerase
MREVVLLMKEGAHWQAFVPGGEMGYAGGNPLYGKTVIFDIELLQVHKTK